jgi:pimeloyl-ACP methyl ester carboxylesterase
MNPFFFGTSAEPLFGVFHPPKASTAKGAVVLLCCPVGQEYMRSHRAFRQMALLLSRAGFPVMRFDYFGTGDSAGDTDQVSLERCRLDVETAVEELRDMTGVTPVALVGLRMGANIAASAAPRLTGVSHVVLWDPITDGVHHVIELVNQSGLPEGTVRNADDVSRLAGTVGTLGFPLTPRLRREIADLDLAAMQTAPGSAYFVVSSSPGEEDESRHALDSFCARVPNARLSSIPSEGNWNEVDEYGSALIPQAAIRCIVDRLSETVS